MSLAPAPDDNPEILAGINREVDKIIGHDDGKTLAELEDLRQNYLFWYYIGLIVVITSAILGFLISAWHDRVYGVSKFGNGLLFAWILIFFAGISPVYLYRNKARQILMPDLVRLFGNLTWSKSGSSEIFWNALRSSGLVGSYDAHAVKDFITGDMKSVAITLAEMTLTRGSGKNRATIFMGAGAHIRLQKPVPVRLILKPRAHELVFFSSNDELKEVSIPSSDFTNSFRTFSNDQVLARTLLTPDVIEQLIKLSMMFGQRHLGVGLRDDNLFLITRGKGDLDPESLFTSAYDLEGAHEVGRQLYMISVLIDTVMKDWRLIAASSAPEPSPIPPTLAS